MNILNAEHITGCKIQLEKSPDGYFLVALWENKPIATAGGENLKKSLRELVERVSKIHAEESMSRDGWRCSRCGKLGPLQSHHKLYKSHGRLDTPANRETLCPACHSKEHGG